MRKSDKKTDNKLRVALTEVCDFALENVLGYQWITHTVNYDAFPASLQVTCAFSSQQAIDDLRQSQQDLALKKEIAQKLSVMSVKIDMSKQVKFIIE